MTIVTWRRRQLLDTGAIWPHREDVVVIVLGPSGPSNTPGEGNQIAVWRPGRKVVQFRRQCLHRAVCQIQHANTEIASAIVFTPDTVRDPRSVRGPTWKSTIGQSVGEILRLLRTVRPHHHHFRRSRVAPAEERTESEGDPLAVRRPRGNEGCARRIGEDDLVVGAVRVHDGDRCPPHGGQVPDVADRQSSIAGKLRKDVCVSNVHIDVPAVQGLILWARRKVSFLIDHVNAIGRPRGIPKRSPRSHAALSKSQSGFGTSLGRGFDEIPNPIGAQELWRHFQPRARGVLSSGAGCHVN